MLATMSGSKSLKSLTVAATLSVPFGGTAGVIMTGTSRLHATSAIFSESVDTTSASSERAFFVRSMVHCISGLPQISLSIFSGMRLEARRAGMTPRTLEDIVPNCTKERPEYNDYIRDADCRMADSKSSQPTHESVGERA